MPSCLQRLDWAIVRRRKRQILAPFIYCDNKCWPIVSKIISVICKNILLSAIFCCHLGFVYLVLSVLSYGKISEQKHKVNVFHTWTTYSAQDTAVPHIIRCKLWNIPLPDRHHIALAKTADVQNFENHQNKQKAEVMTFCHPLDDSSRLDPAPGMTKPVYAFKQLHKQSLPSYFFI